ncbi:MAG: cyclic nucleotide-binding domain-containing protein [Chthoniobacterales bacterium]
MNRHDLVEEIAAHPFLLGMSEHHLQLLADCAIRTQFDAGQTIFREGETANRFYLIEQGEIVLEAAGSGDQAAVIEILGSGDLLGWSWIFPPYVWHFTARATQPTSAIFFYATVLREHCEKDHSLGFELFKRMSAVMIRRLQSARARFRNASSTADAAPSR